MKAGNWVTLGVVVLALGAGGYILYKKKKAASGTASTSPSVMQSLPAPTTSKGGTNVYDLLGLGITAGSMSLNKALDSGWKPWETKEDTTKKTADSATAKL